MDTLEFLTRILPDKGVYYLALIDSVTKRTAHKVYTDLETMAREAMTLDKRKVNVYHACVAYKEPFIEVAGKRKYRVAANQLSAKTFWVDMDCGEDKAAKGAGYLLQAEATRALIGFARTLGLPDPMIVSSGYGVHGYWPLNESISPARWIKIAEALKAALAYQRILVDSGITADFARILRPIGTTNKKRDGRTVKLIRNAPDTNVDEFERILLDFVSTHAIDVDPPEYDRELNSDLTSHIPADIPVWADTVADKCQQVARMRDTKGDVNYEHWRGVIGIIKFCQEGVELAHEWSSERANTNHGQLDVDKMYNTWDSAPTTCGFFDRNNPGGCQGCEFKDEGKFKSPIVLGRREEITVEHEVEVVKDGAVITTTVPALPHGYVDRAGTLHRQTIDADGVIHEHAISSTMFYPRTRIKREDDKYALSIRAHLPREGVKDFDISQGALASPMELQKSLAEYQIVTTNNKDAGMHMTAYMKDWLEKLKQETDEQNTYQNFGWQDADQNFLLGDRMYHFDGTVREVLVGANARGKLDNFPYPRGSLQEWADAITFLYSHVGQEYRQYTIASALGSVLTNLSSDPLYKGLVFALVGGETGMGKTTLARAALSAFGDPDKMSLKTDQGATLNARYMLMGTYKDLPLLVDEVTNIDPEEMSAFCYTVSLGEEKMRLTVTKGSGVGFAQTNTWATSVFVTANADLHAILSSKNANSQAEAVRMIQIKVDNHQMVKNEASVVNAAVRKLERSKGMAGDALLRYVVSNRPEVEAIMLKWASRIEKAVPETKYRFYRGHAECSLAAIEICNKLGVTTFNLERLFEYVVRLFAELAMDVSTTNSLTPEDALSAMLTSFSNRIIVSNEYRDKRGEPPEILSKTVVDPIGRYIMGNKVEDKLAGRLYLSIAAIRDWCSANRTTYASLMGAAEAMGLPIPLEDNRFFIGRGTGQVVGQARCICLDYNKLQAIHGGINRLDNVTPLKKVM